MPVVSMFYGLIIRMYHFDNLRHKAPNIYMQYGDQTAVIGIPDGNMLDGELKPNKMKLVQAWIEIHQEELMADWQLAIKGQNIESIAPLR